MLQPFKFITVVMKDRTNHGVTAPHNTATDYVDRNVLAQDLRYQPITFGDDGFGEPFSDSNKATKKMIGVLLESFNKPYAQHKVLVHGIVPMKAEAAVRAGMYVYWDTTNNRLTKTSDSTTGTPLVGRAMTSAKADGSIIDVLIV